MISIGMLRDVWSFRSFIGGSVRREFQSRYQGTLFGPFWIVAQPLAMILVYTVIFANLMKPSLPGHTSRFAYSIYLCSGVLTWSLFTDMLGRCVNIFIENGNLLKKLRFPKICLPIIVATSGLLNFAIVMTLFLLFLLVSGNFPGWNLLAAIPVLLIQVAFTMGLGIFLATINVFYRDVGQTVGVVMQFWFWLTPIVYAPRILPPIVSEVMSWNPIWPLIDAYHTIFLGNSLPVWETLFYPACLAMLFIVLGVVAFLRLQGEIVDEL
ncbi:MAG: ABC transporter permease [Burkholderiaceae bacterium]|nr:ABC transporter permease [Burkholderiaceae bacterium]